MYSNKSVHLSILKSAFICLCWWTIHIFDVGEFFWEKKEKKTTSNKQGSKAEQKCRLKVCSSPGSTDHLFHMVPCNLCFCIKTVTLHVVLLLCTLISLMMKYKCGQTGCCRLGHLHFIHDMMYDLSGWRNRSNKRQISDLRLRAYNTEIFMILWKSLCQI